MFESYKQITTGFYEGSPLKRGSLVYLKDNGNYTDKKTNIPWGITLQEIVDIDLTRFHLNFLQDQASIGSRIQVLTDGVCVIEHGLDKKQKKNYLMGSKLFWNAKTKKINLKKNRNNTFFGIGISPESNGFLQVKICL